MILLDTDVMVDILRGYEPAKEWLKSAQEIGVPGLVAMELIQGCQNAREQRQLEKSLRNDHAWSIWKRYPNPRSLWMYCGFSGSFSTFCRRCQT